MENNHSKPRREFLSTLGAASIVAATVSKNSFADSKNDSAKFLEEQPQAVLPKLDFNYDALEPYIDKETMETHHTKHHQAYVDGINAARKKIIEAREKSDYSTLEHWTKKLTFHSGGHFLHSLFWKTLCPASQSGNPSDLLSKRINMDFGSFESFKEQFSAAASAVEGSGWALLHVDNQTKALSILIAENQHKLSPWGSTPILGIDVWEHAYYLKYRNKRAEYIKAWWNVINWNQVSKNFEI
jgi:Fe-Mn family superoxide dismutase